MTKKKASAQLKKARKLIEKGWARGTTHIVSNGVDHYCSIGALQQVIGGAHDIYPEDSIMYEKCFGYLAQEVGHSIVYFNDRPTTTKSMVLEMYDKAIAKAIEDETSS